MKAESNTMPQSAFLVEQRGDLADVSFFENAVETQKEETSVWSYDYYILTVPFRSDLEATIEENYAAWIKASKDAEVEDPPEPSENDILKERLAQAEKLIDTMLGVE